LGCFFLPPLGVVLTWQLVKAWKREYLESQRLRLIEVEVGIYREEFGRLADDYSQLKRSIDEAGEKEGVP